MSKYSGYNYTSTYVCKRCKIKFRYGVDYSGNPIGYSKEFCGAFCDGFYQGQLYEKTSLSTVQKDVRASNG